MQQDFQGALFSCISPEVRVPKPHRLRKPLLLQILFSVRPERLLVEAIDYSLLKRWFLGMNLEDRVGDHSVFSSNRERRFHAGLEPDRCRRGSRRVHTYELGA